MKIEITDLPNGKTIKHINIDITFDDIQTSEDDKVKLKIDTTQNPSKISNIPDEMQNGQF